MGKYIKILITGIVVSMFYFPFEFTFLPGINTKMAMAGLGLAFLLFALVRERSLSVPSPLFILLCLAGLVSLVSLFSITYNRTPDTSYVSYIVSASVWLSAAYVACLTIRLTHGRIDAALITYYLIGVCVFQCIIAIVIDSVPAVQRIVDRVIAGGEFFHKIHRLYGIGAGLEGYVKMGHEAAGVGAEVDDFVGEQVGLDAGDAVSIYAFNLVKLLDEL